MKKIGNLLNRLREMMGISYLSIDFMNLTKMHSWFGLAINLSSVFIATFILRSGGTVLAVSLYSFLCYAFETLLNLTVPLIANRARRTTITMIGLSFYIVMYITLLLSRDVMNVIYPLIALCSSLGGAFYYVTFHGHVVAYSTPRNRQLGLSLLGITSNLIVMATPLISGAITSSFIGTTGYAIIFSLTLAGLVLSLLKSRTLPSDPAVNVGYSVVRFAKRFWKDNAMRYMLLTCWFIGLRECLYLYYLNIILFQLVDNELVLGATTTAKAVAAILVFMIMNKKLTPKFRVNGSVHMFIAMLLLSVALVFSMQYGSWVAIVMVIVVSIADNTMMTFIGNSITYTAYEVMEFHSRKHPDEDLQLEMLPVRGATQNFGRVVGMLMFFFIPFAEGSPLPLVFFTILGIPCAIFNILADKELKKLEGAV